jgi:hypothetical protein
MKANELDIVELTESFQGLVAGDVGTVVVSFTTPSEAYDIEFNEKGVIAYSAPPEAFKIVRRFLPIGDIT